MMNFRNNMQKCQEYIKALDEERKKIQVFHRELPLCLELVTQAIEACKQQLRGTGTTTTDCVDDHSECSVQTTSDGPILEEFIPLKWSNSTTDDDEEELESNKSQINDINLNDISEKSGKKSDWLSSVQLWNQTPDSATTQEEHQPKKVTVVEVKRSGSGGAFHPFQKEKSSNEHEINNNHTNNNNKPTSNQAASSCSSAQEADMGPSSGGNHGGGGGGNKKEKDGQSQRKARRCWSPELHRRFVHALKQLGGSHVATPKQIRDLMKVDGLTNDEVKSHLQKYRLHTRRPSSAVHNNANQQAPQFVVVGGIWVPHAATTAGDTTTVAAPGGIYAPVATVAAPPPMHQTSSHRQQQKQSSQSHCVERASHSEGGVHSNSNSPATSSSTHTTTASHAN